MAPHVHFEARFAAPNWYCFSVQMSVYIKELIAKANTYVNAMHALQVSWTNFQRRGMINSRKPAKYISIG